MAESQGSIKFHLSNPARIKQFKIAIQSLAKIGSELLIEGIPERLILRCINTAKSAFMAVTFQENFFESYQVYNSTVVHAAVLMKHVLACFRTQKVTKMVVEVELEHNTLSHTLHCDRGMMKKYCVHCIDAEVLHATVDRSMFPTHVIAEAKELNRLLASFQSSLEEITVIANPDSGANAYNACQFQSFVDPAKVHSDNSLRTSIQLDTKSMFLSYEHQADQPSDVTFNLKDFRALVGFCDAIGANVGIWFDCPGSSVLAEPSYTRGLEPGELTAELVLATLMESQIGHTAAGTTPARGLQTPGNVPGDTPYRTPAAGRTGAARQQGSSARRSHGLRSLRTGATAGADRRSRLARGEDNGAGGYAADMDHVGHMDHDHHQEAGPAPTLLHFNRDDMEEDDGPHPEGMQEEAEEDEQDWNEDLEGLPPARMVPDDFDEGLEGEEEADEELPATPPRAYAEPGRGPVIL